MSRVCSLPFESVETGSTMDINEYHSIKRERIWDAYCWICHGNNAKYRCSTCIRSYHNECIGSKDDDQTNSEFRCELCVRLDMAIDNYAKRWETFGYFLFSFQ